MLFRSLAVLLEARRDIVLEQYCKVINVEANIVTEMVRTKYLPAAIRYQTELATNVAALKAAGMQPDAKLLTQVSDLIAAAQNGVAKLEEIRSKHITDLQAEAEHYCHSVLPQLLAIRKSIDALEGLIPDANWPVPTYEEILFIK